MLAGSQNYCRAVLIATLGLAPTCAKHPPHADTARGAALNLREATAQLQASRNALAAAVGFDDILGARKAMSQIATACTRASKALADITPELEKASLPPEVMERHDRAQKAYSAACVEALTLAAESQAPMHTLKAFTAGLPTRSPEVHVVRDVTPRVVRRSSPRSASAAPSIPELASVAFDPRRSSQNGLHADFDVVLPDRMLPLTRIGPAAAAAELASTFRHIPYHGEAIGATGCATGRSCSPLDASALLISILRQQHVSAHLAIGAIEIDAESAKLWLEVPSVSAAEELLALGGVPVKRTGTGLALEHFWVRALVDGAWINLDPSFPITGRHWVTRQPRSLTRPADLVRSYLESETRNSPFSISPATATARVAPLRQYRVLWMRELAAIPPAYRFKVTGSLAGGPAFEISLPRAAQHGLVFSGEEVSGALPALEATFGQDVPPYLLRTESVLRCGETELARTSTVPIGTAQLLRLSLPSPASMPKEMEIRMSGGVPSVVTVSPHLWSLGTSAPAGVDFLHAAGHLLFAGISTELDAVAKSLGGGVLMGPSVATTSLGVKPADSLAPFAFDTYADGVQMDVNRFDAQFVPLSSERAPVFAAQSGLALSWWEGEALAIATNEPTTSAVGALTRKNDRPMQTLTRTTQGSEALSWLQPGSRADIETTLQQGWVAFFRSPQIDNWSGDSYVLIDPKTGYGRFMIRGKLDGATTTTRAEPLVARRRSASSLSDLEQINRERYAMSFAGWPDVFTASEPPSKLRAPAALLAYVGVVEEESVQASGPRIASVGTLGPAPVWNAIGLELDPPVSDWVRAQALLETEFNSRTNSYTGAVALMSVNTPTGQRLLPVPLRLLQTPLSQKAP